MARTEYPRPSSEKALVSKRDLERGAAFAFLAIGALFSSLEVLLVGEELSTLGERLLLVTRNDGPLHFIETGFGIGSGVVGLVVFALSWLRIVAGIRFAMRSPRSRTFCFALGPAVVLIDLLCFSGIFAAIVLLLDVWALSDTGRRRTVS